MARADESEQKTAPIRGELVSFIVALFGSTSTALADFGPSPKKSRRALTTEELAAAIAKRDATRNARHTMGKRQMLGVVGALAATPAATSSLPSNGAPSH